VHCGARRLIALQRYLLLPNAPSNFPGCFLELDCRSIVSRAQPSSGTMRGYARASLPPAKIACGRVACGKMA
jgi:hypothetical protein